MFNFVVGDGVCGLYNKDQNTNIRIGCFEIVYAEKQLNLNILPIASLDSYVYSIYSTGKLKIIQKFWSVR